jgi:hypothetical protein
VRKSLPSKSIRRNSRFKVAHPQKRAENFLEETKKPDKGYEIWLATNTDFTKNVKKVTVSKNGSTSTTLRVLKKYKILYQNKNNRKVNQTYYYSPWSKTTTKKTKK